MKILIPTQCGEAKKQDLKTNSCCAHLSLEEKWPPAAARTGGIRL